MNGFVHLDVRSYFSLKEGAFSPEQLAERAARLGMPAVAMTDRDGLYGAARFTAACQGVGVRPILGASLSPLAVTVLATDDIGYGNLCRLITDAHLLGERGDPTLTMEQLLAHAQGLVVLLGSRSRFGKLVQRGESDRAVDILGRFKEAFGDRCFVSVERRLDEASDREVRQLLRVAERAEVRAVAVNSVRYLVREDAFLADALECMRRIVPLTSNNITRRNAEGFLKSARAMRALFAERPDLCDATLEIAERCTFDIGLHQLHFPSFPVPEGRSADAMLQARCLRGLDDRHMARNRQVEDRLRHELQMIRRMGYAAYFLTVADIADDIRGMGILAACRGSAASSLVTYALRISDVDPVHHDLVFERFLNPLRDELPDIDIDVESARREDVYDMILSRYGDDAACVAMIDTFRARSAVREVGKLLGLPEPEVGVIAKAFPHIGSKHLRKAIDSLPELAGTNLNAGQLETLFRVAERIDGFPRHIAMHPCGIVLSDEDLVRRAPMERSAQGYRMVQADKDDVELLGLLKLDILGVRMFSSIRYALDEIMRTEHQKLDLEEIPLDDPATFDLIQASDTIGCFQIESPGQRELLQKFLPTRFEDLIIDISLFRPGPVKSDMVTPFLRRRHQYENTIYAHPLLKPALRETHGVIVYHEQVMRSISAITGCNLSEADSIRRGLGGSDDHLRVLRKDFLRRAAQQGVAEGIADGIWHDLAQFANFGFCKAHAAAFAVPTYRSAWLKTHYPAHFLAGVLTHDPGMYPRRLILQDARQHGIPILPLDVNRSEIDYTVEPADGSRIGDVAAAGALSQAKRGEGAKRPPQSDINEQAGIRLALKDVHGISGAEMRSILEARGDKEFMDTGDFMRRARVSRPVVEALAHAGAFDALDEGRTRRDRLFEAMTNEVVREGEQLALAVQAPIETQLPEYSDAERVRAELDVLGVDASRHIVSFYEALLADLGVTRSTDLWRCRADEWVMVAGVKVSTQTPAIRSGQRIIFVTIDDATGPVECTFFESVQARCARTVFHSYILAVWGKVRRTGRRGVSINAEEVWDLTALHHARNDGRLGEAMSQPSAVGASASLGRKLWHSSPGSSGR